MYYGLIIIMYTLTGNTSTVVIGHCLKVEDFYYMKYDFVI